MTSTVIATLPLGEADLAAFIDCANESFERVVARIEPSNLQATRTMWNAEAYMLPIERDYALHLVEVFLVHHVIDLAVRADSGAIN